MKRAKPTATGLESYRRLIELQKQMIELSQHYERSRRECDALRDCIAREVLGRPVALARLRAAVGRWLDHHPRAVLRYFFS